MSDQSVGVWGGGVRLSLLFLFPVLIQEVHIFPELVVTYYSSSRQPFI